MLKRLALITRSYPARCERAIAESRTSAERRAKIHGAFPATIHVPDDFLLSTSSKVARGEIPPWQE